MKKTTLFAILLLLIMTGKSFASSCLTNLKLNKEMKTLNLNDFEIKEAIPGINLINVTVKFFCKQTKAKGTQIQLFFIDDKLKRITFVYEGKQDRPLFNIAQNFYKVGFTKNQNIIDMREIEQYFVSNNNTIWVNQGTGPTCHGTQGKYHSIHSHVLFLFLIFISIRLVQ